ncbi:MAG: PASTA domain-containing protein [Cytophagales bacterium]|nr:MAG: PASTA domain-containing protein [Cytophagales bacterium]
MGIKTSIVLRVRIAFLAVLLFSIAVVVKILIVQIIDGDRWRKMAEENLLQYRIVKATRGNIFSDNGSLLATSLPFYKVAIDPTLAEKTLYKSGIDSLAMLLSRYFKDKSAQEYKRKINDARLSGKHFLVLNKEMVNYQGKKKMKDWPIFREGRLKGGVIFERIDKRFRPFSFLGLRTIGYMNEENMKGAGLEYTFNEQLAGRDGEALFRKMAGGNWKPIHDDSEVRPLPGVDIQTTIDINIQDVAEASLLNHLTKHDADYGCVVLMEVGSGEVKAIANLGKIAPKTYSENYNYAVGSQGLTDPGSTFKLASMIALLEDANINIDDTIDTGNGAYEFYDRVMRDSKPGGHGIITIKEAFEKSSNIGISRLVNEHFGINPQKYITYIRDMGLAEPINFQMDGEAIPYIKDPSSKSWSGISLPWMSIGYELKMSPLQMLTFYNAIANDGKMIQPIIVKSTKEADIVYENFDSKVIREKICSEATLEKVKSLLEGVVENGTASNIKNSVYKIAGKTGTAQKLKDGGYTRTYYTSFVGYFPADRPKYSCIVVIDNPKGFQQYGADVAAPVFKEISDKLYAQDLDLHTAIDFKKFKANQEIFPLVKSGNQEDLKYLCNELSVSNHKTRSDEEWVIASLKNNSIFWKGKKMTQGLVPDVHGMNLKDALYLLENSGLKVGFSGKGRVAYQSFLAGSRILKGAKILIELR